MKHINERHQTQRSFVQRMAMKAKSQVFNAPSYKTISLLPKFFRPHTNSWKRFDQETANFSSDHGQEGGFSATVDVPEDVSVHKSKHNSYIPPRRSSLSIISRIIPVHFAKRGKNPREHPRTKSLSDFDFAKGDDNELKYFDKDKRQFFSDTVINIPEDTQKNKAQGVSIAGGSSKESEWKSYMKDLEEGKLSDGFFDECKNRVKRSWEIFTGETTAHGYKRTMASHRNRLGRILWVIAILGVTSIVMTILYNTVVEQDLNAFSSSIKSQPSNTMPFPAVTVCNLAPYNYSRIEETVLKNYTEQVHQFLLTVARLENVTMKENEHDTPNLFKNFSTKELQEQIGWKLENFLQECYWEEKNVSCSDIFVQSKTITESCFTFNFNPENPYLTDRVGSFSGLRLLINVGNKKQAFKLGVASGLKMLLHEPNEFPNTRENGMLVAPDTTTYISVAKNVYKFLPQPYKAYGTEHCSDTITQDHRYYNFTGYSSCVAECRLRAVLNKCKCVVYGRDPDIPGVSYCTIEEYLMCYIPALRSTYIKSPFEIPNCTCPLPCQKVEYLAQMSSAAFPREGAGSIIDHNSDDFARPLGNHKADYIELKIFYKELFTHIEEHIPLYTWLTIFGNVGGQMGLFTGASVLTILEFLELWILLLWLILHTTYRYFKNRWKSKKVNLNGLWTETGHL